MLVRAIRDRQRGDVARDCLPDLLEERQHRGRAAHAVEADDVGTCVFQPPECIAERPAFPRHGMLVYPERDDGGQTCLLDCPECGEGLLGVRERLPDDEIDPCLDRPAHLLLEHRARGALRRVVLRVDVRVADVSRDQRVVLGCNLLGDRERLPVELLEEVLLADQGHLFAVGVIREGRNDVRTGVDEISVQLRHDLGMVEDSLGHERARLHVATPLELEEIALGADHRALPEPFAQTAVVWGSRTHGVSDYPGLSPERTRCLIGSRSGGRAAPSDVNGTCSRMSSSARRVPRPRAGGSRSSTAWAATTSSIVTIRSPSSTISASRRAASGASVIRSSIPSAWVVLASSNETGCASRRASAGKAWPALRSSARPSSWSPERAARPSVRPEKGRCRSFIKRSFAD